MGIHTRPAALGSSNMMGSMGVVRGRGGGVGIRTRPAALGSSNMMGNVVKMLMRRPMKVMRLGASQRGTLVTSHRQYTCSNG